MAQTMPIAVSVDEAVRLSGLCRSTIYKLLRERKIAGRKRGRSTLVLVSSVTRYLEDLPEYVSGVAAPTQDAAA